MLAFCGSQFTHENEVSPYEWLFVLASAGQLDLMWKHFFNPVGEAYFE